jgi:predicted oxidoreductase (fatty acid repression mutant protein)
MVAFRSIRSFVFGTIFSALVLILSSYIGQEYKDLSFDMAALRTIRVTSVSSLANMGLKSFISRPLRASSKHATAASERSISSTSVKQSSKAFMDAVKSRRSYYALDKRSPIPDAQIQNLVKEAVLHTPSAFNSQTARLVVLLKDDHDKFWELTKSALKPLISSSEAFEQTSAKLDGFKAGYGTVLFFEDQLTVSNLEKNFATYADKFQQWSEHTSAMHQFVLWTALEAEGFGANLQHYNPVVDAGVQREWNVPETWSLKAQLVFGGRAAEPSEKQFKGLEERLKVFGGK